MPIDEGAQPFWEGGASLGISEIGAFLHFHAFHSRKCLLHNEFHRAAISYLRSPEMEAHLANRHANGMSVWMVGDKWTSGQVGDSHLMKSWDTITTGRDTLPCAFCIIQTMGLWAQILGHHTNTSFCKTLFSYSLFTDHNYTYPHTSKSPKTWSESVSCWRDETAVSELLTLTDPLSKLSFAKLPKVYSPSDSISESKVVTAAKLMILVFEHKPGESIYSARHKSTEIWKGKKSGRFRFF